MLIIKLFGSKNGPRKYSLLILKENNKTDSVMDRVKCNKSWHGPDIDSLKLPSTR